MKPALTSADGVRKVTLLVVLVLIMMSAYPGLIESTVLSLPGFLTLLPLLGVWFLFVAFTAVRDLVQQRQLRSSGALHAAVISILAFGLVVLRVPPRLGFAISRPAFEQFLQNTPPPAEADTNVELSRWFGIYHIDRWGQDSRGGTYFRTGTGADMIDTMSYGFTFQANPEGTPFGAARYWRYRLAHDWDTFSVSDDYY